MGLCLPFDNLHAAARMAGTSNSSPPNDLAHKYPQPVKYERNAVDGFCSVRRPAFCGTRKLSR
jgi:hypothetical protein